MWLQTTLQISVTATQRSFVHPTQSRREVSKCVVMWQRLAIGDPVVRAADGARVQLSRYVPSRSVAAPQGAKQQQPSMGSGSKGTETETALFGLSLNGDVLKRRFSLSNRPGRRYLAFKQSHSASADFSATRSAPPNQPLWLALRVLQHHSQSSTITDSLEFRTSMRACTTALDNSDDTIGSVSNGDKAPKTRR